LSLSEILPAKETNNGFNAKLEVGINSNDGLDNEGGLNGGKG
jgi:hypothetical protein